MIIVDKKKILIFGPIGDFGGRELEAGFIAHTLSFKYDVAVCSSSSLTNKSQLFNFKKDLIVFTVNDFIYKKYCSIRFLSFISYLKNKKRGIVSHYANNGIAKKYFSYTKKRLAVMGQLLPKYDLVFICAQLTTGLMAEVIQIAKENNIKVVFRTTGAIGFSDYDFIDLVDCFIHHSVNNANKIQMKKKHNYVVIDQCAYSEKDLLKIQSLHSNDEIRKFLILSRLSPEKGVEEIIDFFLKVCAGDDVLFIAGNGVLECELKNKYQKSRNIQFQGFVNSVDLSNLFRRIDCLIIPSPQESGPLVGIESMCAGKIIISTKVGAMEERMQNTLNDYWFDYGNFESFKNVFFKVKSLSKAQVSIGSLTLKEKYIKEYSIESIKNRYLGVIDNILK